MDALYTQAIANPEEFKTLHDSEVMKELLDKIQKAIGDLKSAGITAGEFVFEDK